MKFLGLIPARGGSKGIPGKNLHPLAGKPLIQYTVDAAKQSRRLDSLFLSSDDPKIISFCRSQGIDCDYVRPAELATDTASMADVVVDVIRWLKSEKNSLPENIVLLQPTCPLRTAGDIDGAIDRFLESAASSLVSVSEVLQHPYECIEASASTWKFLRRPPAEVSRRQDYSDKFVFLNGSIYIVNTEWFLQRKKFCVESESVLYEVPKDRGIDVDTHLDLAMAEALLRM